MSSPVATLVDFSDSIGPMVVKELRQGLRTRVFTWAFLFIQGFLLLFMMSGFSESSDGRNTATSFWVLLQFVLLFVMPFRGLSALHTEVRLNTMELITLTRMSAWRITFGKWLALFSQSLLLAVAVMPYIVLRYFFGGMNVLAELVILVVVIGLSGLLTALMVGLSVIANFLIRCFFTIPVFLLVMRFMGEAIYRVSRGDGVAPFNLDLLAWAGIVPAAIFVGYYLLDMAASRIAPQAVNYVTRRRILGFVAYQISLLVANAGASEGYLVLPFFFFMLLGLDALSEHPATVQSIYLPFRRNAFTRLFENLLTPGWFSGTWYVVLLGAILLGAGLLFPDAWSASGLSSHEEVIGLVLGFVASALFPLAIMLLPRSGHPQPIVSYCLITIFMGVLSATLIPLVEHGDIPVLAWLGMILPPVATYATLNDSMDSADIAVVERILGVMIVLCLAIIHWKWAKIRKAMALAQREDYAG